MPIYTGSEITAARAFSNPLPVRGFVANVREDTGDVLGVVSDKYQVVQNADAFKFADDLIGATGSGGVTYETAGSLWSGRRVFMLINLPAEKVLDDDMARYVGVVNSHDGSGALKVFTTNVRIVCANTCQLAVRTSPRLISIRHMAASGIRKKQALEVYAGFGKYFGDIREFAESLALRKVDPARLLERLFPENEGMSVKQKVSNGEVRRKVLGIFNHKDDLQNYRGTAWGFYNAVSDYVSNEPPRRLTKTWRDNKMSRFIDGEPLILRAQKLLEAA
jgi:phage/plasmid-like protein (TIGR03299 family)